MPSKKETTVTQKIKKYENITESYKILKTIFFKSVQWYGIVNCRIKYEAVLRYIYSSFTKKKSMSQYRIIISC